MSQAIASNSTAALAFDNADDAAAVLAAFKADPHIVAAALYDAHGKLFATYPRGLPAARFPARPGAAGYRFGRAALIGFQPVAEGSSGWARCSSNRIWAPCMRASGCMR